MALSQDDLARRAGINRATISRIENADDGITLCGRSRRSAPRSSAPARIS
ncbi:helix-turn-helix domain-containing protein [Phyllobacterium sp. LjRoot231]